MRMHHDVARCPLRVLMEVTNASDEIYVLTHYYNQAAATVSGQPGKPRLWALTFRKEF
jgi:hypothetical protein